MWVDTLLIFAFFGAFGGVLAAIQTTDVHKLMKLTEVRWGGWPRFFCVALGLFISACGGIGGAIAGLLILLVDGKIQRTDLTDHDRLLYAGTGLVAGFIGFRLLKRVAERFDKVMEAAEKKAEQTAERVTEDKLAQEHQKEMQRDLLTRSIGQGLIAAGGNVRPSEIDQAIRNLELARKEFPRDRTAIIVLARLYANQRRDLQTAIETLTHGLDAVQQQQTTQQKDIADILYNRACYYFRLAKQTADEGEKARLIELMYTDLDRSFQLSSENIQDAHQDTDFQDLKTDSRFAKLTKRPVQEKPTGENI